MKTPPLKLICLFSLALAAGLCDSSAVLYAYEGFNYTSGASVTGQNGGTGNWNGAWIGTASTAVVTPGLTYLTLPTTSGAANNPNQFSTQGNGRFWTGLNSTAGSELWFSVLVNQTATGVNMRIYGLADAGVVNGGFNVGAGIELDAGNIYTRIANTQVATGLTYTAGTTMLLVTRYTFSDTAGQDAMTLWVNPSLTGGVPTGGSTQLGDFSAGWLSSPFVGFRGRYGTLDEIRLGTQFGDVVPEPGVLSLALVGGLGFLTPRKRGARS